MCLRQPPHNVRFLHERQCVHERCAKVLSAGMLSEREPRQASNRGQENHLRLFHVDHLPLRTSTPDRRRRQRHRGLQEGAESPAR